MGKGALSSGLIDPRYCCCGEFLFFLTTVVPASMIDNLPDALTVDISYPHGEYGDLRHPNRTSCESAQYQITEMVDRSGLNDGSSRFLVSPLVSLHYRRRMVS